MKEIYCTRCVKLTPHKGQVDQNGEFVFSCQTEGCGAFVKFPSVADGAELEQLIKDREEVNKPIAEGSQSHKEQSKILSQVLADGTEVAVSEASEEAAPEGEEHA